MPVLMLLVLLLYELINLSSHSSRQYICLIYYSFEGLQVSNRFISLIMSLIIIVSLIKYFCRKINYLKQWVRLNYATTHMRTNLYYTMRNQFSFEKRQVFKDTHREKAVKNQTPALTKSTNMDIWVVGTTNQLFIRGS